MEIPKDRLLKILRDRDDDGKAQLAEQQLPDKVDLDKHADHLARIGIGHADLAPAHPGVLLNRAVAVARADGPAAGLALADELEQNGALADYYLLAATRADLLRRLNRDREAAAAYHRALELAPTAAERRFLGRRLAEVSEPHPH